MGFDLTSRLARPAPHYQSCGFPGLGHPRGGLAKEGFAGRLEVSNVTDYSWKRLIVGLATV